jgi:hypothetical protein
MVKMQYLGVADPKQAFGALRPLRDELIRMQTRCRPFSPDYLVLSAAAKALDTAAYHFTGEADFFALKPHSS